MAEEKGKQEEVVKAEEKNPEKKARKVHIVRVGGKDLDGSMKVSRAISSIRGVSYALANAVSVKSGLGDKKVGELSQEEIKKIEGIIGNPAEHDIPSWMMNRRSDPVEGSDRHIFSANLELTHKMDINELKKKKCYKGVRHMSRLPVRGQRTRSSFRTSATVGVSRSKAKQAKK